MENKKKNMARKMVKVSGQMVREGTKRHSTLTANVRHSNDLAKSETGFPKATSKTYSVSRCGSCNRFGHSHENCDRKEQKQTNDRGQQNFTDGPSNSRYNLQ